MKDRAEIKKNIKENKEEIVKVMKKDLNYFMNSMQLKKEFTIPFPVHDVDKILDLLEERVDLNCEDEWSESNAYFALGDYIEEKVIEAYGPINVVERPRGESIYLDEFGHNQLELKIDRSIQSILDSEVYAPGYRDTVHYYIVPPKMVNVVWEKLDEKYTSGDYKTHSSEIKKITQEQVHEEVVYLFDSILNSRNNQTDSLEEIQKKKNELIEQLYQLKQEEEKMKKKQPMNV